LLVVGLTGGIGSGKSTVSALLAERGAVVIDADQVSREVVEPGQPAYDAVVERFSRNILCPDGTIDRPALSAIVFADETVRRDLEKIVHPAVGARMAELMQAQAETDNVVILDVPLWTEARRDGLVIVVDCPEDVAVARLVEQRGMPEGEARRRMAAQATREERLAKASFVVDNSGSRQQLATEVDRAWEWIQSLR
jgi:dephospho-CoA kinase